MNKNLTEIVFILDRSGSMSGLESDTIGGFNAMIEKQKKAPGEALVSTILFDNVSEVIHDRVNIRDIKPMTDSEYCVRGCTALLDAIGGAIHHIGNVHKYAREEDVPAHTLFVITTDGMENASRRYDSARVKQMIEHEKSKYGWEFLFLGANIDAVETAKHFGISEDRAVNYHSDSVGTRLNYEVVSCAITSMRSGAPMSADWKAPIEADYKTRKGEKNEPHRFRHGSYYPLSRTIYMVRLFHLIHTRRLMSVSKYISALLTLSLVVDIIMVKIKIGGLS